MNARSRPRQGTASDLAGGGINTQVTADAAVASAAVDDGFYGTSPVKRRRSTNAQLDVVDDAIMAALTEEHPATLRGTYYRVVSAGVVDKTDAGYQLVGRQVLKLRRAGRLPYSWITDGTRYIVKPDSWLDVDQMLSDAASSYRRMLWHDQYARVQIFTEKDAITGVIEGVTGEWDVPIGVLRGYASESFAWSVAESLRRQYQHTYLYQLGDHDPSGVDAWRNFEEKVRGFVPDAKVTFQRIAVLPEQIASLKLLTRPTKKSDSRSANFTGESVEVDAIPPSMLRQIVRDAIEQHINERALANTRAVERSERELLTSMIGGA